jgi:flavin reductase (DIM6/NTAB) family NADH-FMN oxidoreductase RutF
LSATTAEYIAGMRQLASGVSIVTTRLGDNPLGLTATSVCSLTAEPPRLLACLHCEADAHGAIAASGVFAINLLGLRHRELAECFGGRLDVFGPDRFAFGRWISGDTGVPLLADALASFDCRLVEAIAAGTHGIFIGEVERVRLGQPEAALAYHDRRFASLVPLPD